VCGAPPWTTSPARPASPGPRSTSRYGTRTTPSGAWPSACTSRPSTGPGGPPAGRIREILVAKLDLVLALVGDSPHAAELLDSKARLFGDICHSFTAELRTILVDQFTRAGATHPEQAADIAITLVLGLEARPDAAELLAPATDALLRGLLGAQDRRPHD
jgi:hypothetical protein